MKKSLPVMSVLLCIIVVPLYAAGDFYADYIEKNPTPSVTLVSDGNDPAQQAWLTRFSDACALIMAREEKNQAEARKILYSLLDEQPDSKDALDLLELVLQFNPAAKKEIDENIIRLAEKHASSIPLNMFVLDFVSPRAWTADFLKNALNLYTNDPQTIAKMPEGMEHVRDIIVMASVFSVEYHKPELAVLMYRCHKAYKWFGNEKINNLRAPLNILHALIDYPLFHVAQGKLEILALYNELRSLYFDSILKDGLDSLAPDEEKLPYFRLCADLVPAPHSEIIAELEKMLKGDPGNIAKTELLAFFYIVNKRNMDASALLQTCLKNAKTKEKGMILLNYTFLSEAERWDELMAFSEEYFQYLPEKTGIELRLDMVRALMEKKDYLRAADVLKHLKSFQSLSGRIQLLVQAGKFEDAYKLLKEQALPRYAAGERSATAQQEEAFIMTASALADMYNDFAATETLYLIWLKEHPGDPLVLNNLAYTYAEQNVKLDEAFKMSSAALKADPGNAAYLDTMAWILYRQKKYKEAAAYIVKAVVAFNGNDIEGMEALEHAGDIYFALNDKVEAKFYWLRVMNALKTLELETKVKNEADVKRIQEKLDKLKENTEK